MSTNTVLSLYAALRRYIDIFEHTSNHPIIGLTKHPYVVLSCANTTSTIINGVCVVYISVIESKGNDKYYMVNSCPRIGPHPPSHVVAGTISTKYNVAPYVGSSFATVYDEVYTYTQNLARD